MGYDPLSVNEEQFTTSSVVDELHSGTTPYTRIKLALDAEKLKIQTPSTASLEEVEEASCKVGDLGLSQADKDILAAALDLSKSGFSLTLVSDDYAIQNVVEFLNIRYVSLTTFGIRYRFKWVLYCPACKKRCAPNVRELVCSFCGTRLKRKVLRKKKIRE